MGLYMSLTLHSFCFNMGTAENHLFSYALAIKLFHSCVKILR